MEFRIKQPLKNILLVDDDESTNLLHMRVIRKMRCAKHVQTAENGAQALAYLQSCSGHSGPSDVPAKTLTPDLILLDVRMPVMDAWEFLQEYQKLDLRFKARALFLMLTTPLLPEDEKRVQAIPDVTGCKNKLLNSESMQSIMVHYFSDHVEPLAEALQSAKPEQKLIQIP